MVLEFLLSLKQVVKRTSYNIDCAVSKLHYLLTVGIIFLFCILVTSRQYFGDPIECMGSTDKEVPEKVLNSYCWIQATFTLARAYDVPVGVHGVPHPGIAGRGIGEISEPDKLYHNYYQWVWFVLLLQALLFFFPRYMWQNFESGNVKKLLLDLNLPLSDDSKKRDLSCDTLATYLSETRGRHIFYGVKFYFCEAMYFVNVIAQMYAINDFLGGAFLNYGSSVVKFSNMDFNNRTDPMIKVFPRVTKCLFHKYGPSGTVQRHDVLCVLPLNIVNEKIFLVMWFWFVVLATITGIWLLWLCFIFVSGRLRFNLLLSCGKFCKREEVFDVCSKVNFGDWFLLYFLCQNMDGLNFKRVIHKLSNLLSEVKDKKGICCC